MKVNSVLKVLALDIVQCVTLPKNFMNVSVCRICVDERGAK